MSTTTARIAPSSGFSGQGGVHPARYSPAILVNIREELKRIEGPVLDPFAGTGRIHLLGRDDTVGIEIGPEWAQLHQRTFRGDATELPFSDETFGAVAISPCYGNRMADLYDGRDGSRRHTYRIALGRLPSANSAAALQWGRRTGNCTGMRGRKPGESCVREGSSSSTSPTTSGAVSASRSRRSTGRPSRRPGSDHCGSSASPHQVGGKEQTGICAPTERCFSSCANQMRPRSENCARGTSGVWRKPQSRSRSW
jgi:hypothetical protein